ncbi:MAG TPA: hypothetical protein VIK20_01755 [Bacteroidales bacterium]
MKNKLTRILMFLLLIVLPITFVNAKNENLESIINLEGSWKFSIGNKTAWLTLNYNDGNWTSVHVPSPWEEQGFPGYDGYGIYRKKVVIPQKFNTGELLYLKLGYIDDVDEVYFNGVKIGSTGTFPPNFETAYQANRKYYIPSNLIKFNGTNLIAVKVYDAYQWGGIVSGDVGIYKSTLPIKLDVNLQCSWKFHTGDNIAWKENAYIDCSWSSIFVPSTWEDQGFRCYDGFAWYRKSFIYKGGLTDEKLVLMLGKIDDLDQAFLNGVLIGSTKLKFNESKPFIIGSEYKTIRGYYFPRKLLRKGLKNTIAVRVYDKIDLGGIYEGPVGIVTQRKYLEYLGN